MDYSDPHSDLATIMVKNACEVRAPKNVKISFFKGPGSAVLEFSKLNFWLMVKQDVGLI